MHVGELVLQHASALAGFQVQKLDMFLADFVIIHDSLKKLIPLVQ
jgi:hypothetical protein